jgi:hypothetical protein
MMLTRCVLLLPKLAGNDLAALAMSTASEASLPNSVRFGCGLWPMMLTRRILLLHKLAGNDLAALAMSTASDAELSPPAQAAEQQVAAAASAAVRACSVCHF